MNTSHVLSGAPPSKLSKPIPPPKPKNVGFVPRSTGTRMEKTAPRVQSASPPPILPCPPHLKRSLHPQVNSDAPVDLRATPDQRQRGLSGQKVAKTTERSGGAAETTVTTGPYSDEQEIRTLLKVRNSHMSSQQLQEAVRRITDFMKDETATECNLSELDIRELPDFYPFAERLSERCTHLNLSGNQLTELPKNFLLLKNPSKLKYLNLSGNPIKDLPDWFYGIKPRTFSTKVRAFLKHFPRQAPQEKLDGSCLENFILDRTQITKISKRIRNHLHLKELSLRDVHQLHTLPDEISQLTQLENLRISKTKISTIPPLSSSLVELDASGTSLTKLPSNIGKLEKLEVLNLSNTHIRTLPTEMGSLPIKSLDLSDNPHIKRLPGCVFELKKLVRLDCRNTKNLKLTDQEVKGLTHVKHLMHEDFPTSIDVVEVVQYYIKK